MSAWDVAALMMLAAFVGFIAGVVYGNYQEVVKPALAKARGRKDPDQPHPTAPPSQEPNEQATGVIISSAGFRRVSRGKRHRSGR